MTLNFPACRKWVQSNPEDEMQAQRDADLERDFVIPEDEPHVLHKVFYLAVSLVTQLFLDYVQPHRLLHTHSHLSKIIIIWHLGKKGALRTAIDSQENILTLLQEKGTQSK